MYNYGKITYSSENVFLSDNIPLTELHITDEKNNTLKNSIYLNS